MPPHTTSYRSSRPFLDTDTSPRPPVRFYELLEDLAREFEQLEKAVQTGSAPPPDFLKVTPCLVPPSSEQHLDSLPSDMRTGEYPSAPTITNKAVEESHNELAQSGGGISGEGLDSKGDAEKTVSSLSAILKSRSTHQYLNPTAGSARARMLSIYKSPWFEPGFGLLIMFNAICMIAELQYDGMQLGYEIGAPGSNRPASESWPNAESAFSVLEWIFGSLFALEICYKLLVLCEYFWKDMWNWIDSAIVACFIIEKGFGSFVPVGTQWVRIFRLVRLGRLLRLVRTLEGFDALYLMTTALKGSLSILAWAFVLLFVIQTTVSLVVSRILHSTYFEDKDIDDQSKREVYAYLGTWTKAILTTFEMILANWAPVTRFLATNVTEWFTLCCLIYKFVIGFAVIGVLNGVFIQETFKVAATDDTIMVRQTTKAQKTHRRKMEHLFLNLDASGDGEINFEEFSKIADHPEVRIWLASMGLSVDDLENVFGMIDADKDESITVDELITGVDRLKGWARSIDLLTFCRNFQETTSPHRKSLRGNMIPKLSHRVTSACTTETGACLANRGNTEREADAADSSRCNSRSLPDDPRTEQGQPGLQDVYV